MSNKREQTHNMKKEKRDMNMNVIFIDGDQKKWRPALMMRDGV